MNISNNKTTIHFLNHSSLLINYKENYIYTDPFFQNPAFDTWLPTPPMYINPLVITRNYERETKFSGRKGYKWNSLRI